MGSQREREARETPSDAGKKPILARRRQLIKILRACRLFLRVCGWFVAFSSTPGHLLNSVVSEGEGVLLLPCLAGTGWHLWPQHPKVAWANEQPAFPSCPHRAMA